ncbi:MAG: IclR family transcriptional regulator C-terminal domain-containing protein [Pseudomonadota bacterium]
MKKNPRARRVGSVETAGVILQALMKLGGAARLKQLEMATGISSATLHRYMLSLIETGLVQRDPAGHQYSFGLFAFCIGEIAGRNTELVTAVTPHLMKFSESIGETSAIGIWRNGGAFIAKWISSGKPISVALSQGTPLSLTKTSTGMMLAACLPRALTEPLIADECSPGGRSAGRSIDDIYDELAAIRQAGICQVKGKHIAGISSLSAPVFFPNNELAFVVSVVGNEAAMDVDLNGPVAIALLALKRLLSNLMGSGELI